MTESEIVEVEQAIGSRLPQAYRCVLHHYPTFLLRQAAENGVDEDCHLCRTKSALLDANTAENLALFPPDCFIIGENQCGDLYAILTTDPDAPVFIGGPHQGEYPTDASGNAVPAFASVHAFVASLHRSSENDEIPSESWMDQITGIAICLLIFPVLVVGSILAALTAPFVVMILWIKRSFDPSPRTSRSTGTALSRGGERENPSSSPGER